MNELATTDSIYSVEVLQSIRRKGDKFSLTDLWRLSGSDASKRPANWQQRDEVRVFINMAARFSKCTPNVLLETTRGKHGSSWATEQIALEYAQYLDPALAVLVNQVFIERLEEEANPELAIERGNERARKNWLKKGKDEKWIDKRIEGVATRKAFTGTLASHGVKNEGFKNCTNAIYNPLFGGTADVVRHKKHLVKGVSVRDHMDRVELAAVGLAELLATEKIEKQGLRGNAQCEMACTSAAKNVATAIIQSRKR